MSKLDHTLSALGDPTRRELLRRLAEHPRRAGELAKGFKISRPAIAKHARVLRRAGLIEARREGRERIYRLAPQGRNNVDDLIETLRQVSAFWDAALASFKKFAEESR